MAAAAEEAVVGEQKKLFVGGIPGSAREEELREHFGGYGEVRDVVVMRDRNSGHGRGFAFVEFVEADAAEKALDEKEKPKHVICGRLVDVKRARARPGRNQGEQSSHLQHPNQSSPQSEQYNQPAWNNTDDGNGNVCYDSKKVFVGGLRDNITEEEFRNYFEKFGTITDVVVMYDSVTNRSRGFGFITFDSEEAVQKVMKRSFHELSGTRVEAKIAIPKDGHHYRNGRGRGSRTFGGGGPASYDGSIYPQYNGRYVLYHGYMPQPIPAHPYYAGGYPYAMGGYSYGNTYPSQRAISNVSGTIARRGPPIPIYGAYPAMYSGYGGVYGAGYVGATSSGQYGVDGASDGKRNQTSVDLQAADVTATITTKLESVKLDSQ